MNLLNRLFSAKTPRPEDKYIVTVTEEMVSVFHPKWPTGSVKWKDIHTILFVNTDEGPWLPDVWLTLISDDSKCLIPQGANGFDDVYDLVSKYEGFNFDNTIKSMACTSNAEFLLWSNKGKQNIN